MVPIQSARFSNNDNILDRRNFSMYDHADMKDGKVESGAIPLFEAIKADLNFDSLPPTIFITAPLDRSLVSGTLLVSAQAGDNVAVTKVEFYLNGLRQFTDSTTPYAWTWDTSVFANGPYTLSAKAYDAAGNVAASPDVNITVNNGSDSSPPLISSVNASTTSATATISWLTNESANSQVEYGLSACPCGTTSPLDLSSVAKHSVTLTGLSPSTTYHYRVRSRDAAGNLAVSANNTFRTTAKGNTAPSVTLGKPNGGENWPVGSLQTITWNAVDDVAVTAVSLFYTTDGLSWNPIAISISNSGTFAWTVANSPSQLC